MGRGSPPRRATSSRPFCSVTAQSRPRPGRIGASTRPRPRNRGVFSRRRPGLVLTRVGTPRNEETPRKKQTPLTLTLAWAPQGGPRRVEDPTPTTWGRDFSTVAPSCRRGTRPTPTSSPATAGRVSPSPARCARSSASTTRRSTSGRSLRRCSASARLRRRSSPGRRNPGARVGAG